MNTLNLISHVFRTCRDQMLENLNNDGLVEHLFSKKHINRWEKEKIKLPSRTSFEQNGILLDILSTREDQVLDVVIEYLKHEGTQKRLISLLDETKSKYLQEHQNLNHHEKELDPAPADIYPEDFDLQYDAIVRIREHLKNSPKLINDWPLIKDELVIGCAENSTIGEKLESTNSTKRLLAIGESIAIWIGMAGPTVATFNNFIKIIKPYDQQTAANLMKDRQKIKDICEKSGN